MKTNERLPQGSLVQPETPQPFPLDYASGLVNLKNADGCRSFLRQRHNESRFEMEVPIPFR